MLNKLYQRKTYTSSKQKGLAKDIFVLSLSAAVADIHSFIFSLHGQFVHYCENSKVVCYFSQKACWLSSVKLTSTTSLF